MDLCGISESRHMGISSCARRYMQTYLVLRLGPRYSFVETGMNSCILASWHVLSLWDSFLTLRTLHSSPSGFLLFRSIAFEVSVVRHLLRFDTLWGAMPPHRYWMPRNSPTLGACGRGAPKRSCTCHRWIAGLGARPWAQRRQGGMAPWRRLVSSLGNLAIRNVCLQGQCLSLLG